MAYELPVKTAVKCPRDSQHRHQLATPAASLTRPDQRKPPWHRTTDHTSIRQAEGDQPDRMINATDLGAYAALRTEAEGARARATALAAAAAKAQRAAAAAEAAACSAEALQRARPEHAFAGCARPW
jgi:hypothetical protein